MEGVQKPDASAESGHQGSGTSGDGDESPAANPDLAALRAENEKMAGIIKELRSNEASVRDKKRAAEEAERKALEEQGKYQPLAESLQNLVAQRDEAIKSLEEKIAQYEPMVEGYNKVVKSTKEQVEAAMNNGLPDSLKTTLAMVGDPIVQLALINEFKSSVPNSPPTAPSGPSNSPGGERNPVDIEVLLTEMHPRTVAAKYPKEWAAYCDTATAYNAPTDAMGSLLFGK